MRNCIKGLYDYDLVENSTKSGNISLKSNFQKKLIDGFNPQCKFCKKRFCR